MLYAQEYWDLEIAIVIGVLLLVIASIISFFMGKFPFNRLNRNEKLVVTVILLLCCVMLLIIGICDCCLVAMEFDTIDMYERELREAKMVGNYLRINNYEEILIEHWTYAVCWTFEAVVIMILSFCAFLNCWMIIFRNKYFKLKGAKLRKSLWE